MYGANRTDRGWWLWCFNNNGVTKFPDEFQEIDASAASDVTVDVSRVKATSVTELVRGAPVALSGGKFSQKIPAGDLAIFEVVCK